MLTLRKFSNLFAAFLIAALLALAVAGAAPAVQKPVSALTPTWYVRPTGLDTNTCKTPAVACKTIQAAIGKASSGGIIKVAVGAYTVPTGVQVVLVSKSLTLLGGWSTNFKAQTGRSTIDGKNLRRGVTIKAGLTVTMDRFQVQFGHANPGGGIANAGNLTLSNSIVTRSWAPANKGGGIWSTGTLTIDSSTISYSTVGGGLQAGGAVAISNSTLDRNTPQAIGYTGSGLTINNSTISNSRGRGISATGTVTLNNTTVTGTLGNATFTDGSGVESQGTVNLFNTTVTNNITGVKVDAGTTTLTNSIVAGNSSDAGVTPNDCAGALTSGGYNLIGSTDSCTFTDTTGDLTGTNLAPIDAKLSVLQDHGGPTLTHALLSDSPAIDAGNPATCLPTDQRGYVRPAPCDIGAYELFTLGVYSITRLSPDNTSAGTVRFAVLFNESVVGVDGTDFTFTTTGAVAGPTVTSVAGLGDSYTVTVNSGTGDGTLRLDLTDDNSILGTYNDDPLGGPAMGDGNFTTGEVYTMVNPSVVSVNTKAANPTSATLVTFTVTFSTAVTGVNLVAPFSDFAVTTDGLTGAKVAAVTGSGKTYTVTVNHGQGSGTLRLDVIDDDTIAEPTSGRTLGGSADGGFTAGQSYSIVPMPQAPGGTVWDTTPTFKWTKLAGVTQYQFQLFDGFTPVYSSIVQSTACSATACSKTPGTQLNPSSGYNWKVQAWSTSSSSWRDYSPSKAFTLKAPLDGFWASASSWVSFYVAPNRVQIKQFTYYIISCNKNIAITYMTPVNIVNGKFSFTGSAYANGTFTGATLQPTNASGTAGFNNFYLQSCGYVINGGFPWSAYWIDSSQPAAGDVQHGLSVKVMPMPDAPFGLFMPYTIQR